MQGHSLAWEFWFLRGGGTFAQAQMHADVLTTDGPDEHGCRTASQKVHGVHKKVCSKSGSRNG